MDNRILLCSDLDRTILPNGEQEESPQARFVLREIASKPEVTLAYVTGRHKKMLIEAVEEFHLPVPDYAIGDVGTTIYDVKDEGWVPWAEWREEIGRDWADVDRERIVEICSGFPELQLQEPEKQNDYKVSYYLDRQAGHRALIPQLKERVGELGAEAGFIWSVDEQKNLGLLDIIPQRATKVHAVRFLMKKKGFRPERTVFAGDSGNDLPALTSGLQAVLVRNAREEVRKEALTAVSEKGLREKLYLACGDFYGLNGNYSAGVVEGLAHFLPETLSWIKSALRPDSG